MATTATANIPEAELEEGQPGLGRPRRIGYVRDITYKVIPFCALFLIIFSAGGILLATLAHNEPIPHQGTVVISILLLVFLILFWVGSGYLYIKKRYPPLPKGPDAPDRPPPHNESFLTVLKRILNMLTAIHKRLHNRKEARAENNPAELEDHQTPGSRPPRSHQTNGQAYNRSLQSHPVGPRESLRRHSYAPHEPTIPERPGSPGSPDSIPHDMDARVSRQDSHIRSRGYPESHRDTVSPMTDYSASVHQGPPSGYPPNNRTARMNENSRTQGRTPAGPKPIQPYRKSYASASSNLKVPGNGGTTREEYLPPNSPYLQSSSQASRTRPEYGTHYAYVPENPYGPLFARMPFDRLDEKDFYGYNHPPSTLAHKFEVGKWIGEYRYYWEPNYWGFGPRQTYTNAPRTRDRPPNDTDDIWTRTTRGSSTLRSKQSSGLSRHTFRKSSDTTTSQSRDEHKARVTTNSSSHSKKQTLSAFDSLGIEREKPRGSKKHDPSSSQKRENESKTVNKPKAPSENSVTGESMLRTPTPPSSIGSATPRPPSIPTAPPKTNIKLARHRVPEVTTDDEAGERSVGKDKPSPRFNKPITSSTPEDEEKLSAAAWKLWQQFADGKYDKQQPVKPVEKAWLWNGQGDRSYHRRGASFEHLEVPPRSSSIGFHSHFAIDREKSSETSTAVRSS